MVKFMHRIPAGTFLIPMLVGAVWYTVWPDLFQIGGLTEAFLGGGNLTFLIGAICFCSGVSINVKDLGKLFKRHGVIVIVKLILSMGFSLLFIRFFGQEGILGISALAFTVAISSINPSLYISVVYEYGEEIDSAAFGLTSLFSIPAVPLFVYGIVGAGGLDWMPILSTLIPLILGVVLGNLDAGFKQLFGPGIAVLVPILGWNLGQGMNLVAAFQSGVYGILLAVLFYILTVPMVVTDKFLLKNDGIAALAMNSAAGSSATFPAIVAQANPQVMPYVTSAAAQVLTVAIVTILVTPILVRILAKQTDEE